MAASFFAKTFTNPIEQIIVPSNDLRQSFVNAKGARNFGIELEFRRSLATLWDKLRDFGVSSNFTFVDSNVDLKPEDAAILTSQSRPLLGQSRYIANGILEWRRAKWHSDAQLLRKLCVAPHLRCGDVPAARHLSGRQHVPGFLLPVHLGREGQVDYSVSRPKTSGTTIIAGRKAISCSGIIVWAGRFKSA